MSQNNLTLNGLNVEVRLGGGPWIPWDSLSDKIKSAYECFIHEAVKKGGPASAYQTENGGSITIKITGYKT